MIKYLEVVLFILCYYAVFSVLEEKINKWFLSIFGIVLCGAGYIVANIYSIKVLEYYSFCVGVISISKLMQCIRSRFDKK